MDNPRPFLRSLSPATIELIAAWERSQAEARIRALSGGKRRLWHRAYMALFDYLRRPRRKPRTF